MQHKKTELVVIFLLLTFVQAHSICKNQNFFGKTNNWQTYASSINGIYVDVDYSILGLTKTPGISTSLQCESTCWTVDGISSHYNVTNTSFRVYLKYTLPQDLIVQKAKDYKFELNYIIFPRQ